MALPSPPAAMLAVSIRRAQSEELSRRGIPWRGDHETRIAGKVNHWAITKARIEKRA